MVIGTRAYEKTHVKARAQLECSYRCDQHSGVVDDVVVGGDVDVIAMARSESIWKYAWGDRYPVRPNSCRQKPLLVQVLFDQEEFEVTASTRAKKGRRRLASSLLSSL